MTWKNYYATLFKTSVDSAVYSLENFGSLLSRTLAFRDALFSSTLDPAVIDAVSSNLAVLRSPTVLRLEDGSFYGWEGVHQNSGSCEGTCQHVWNYAYALCFLFPSLERSIRNAETAAMLEDGKTVFRLKLPYGREPGDFRACVDGQMGTVIKMYREWKISGDDEWLRGKWEKIKKLISYAWSESNPDRWDRDKDGVLEGRQHHTLDMELFGPSSWLEGMYLAALKAGTLMAEHLGDLEAANEYSEIYEKGKAYTAKELFNGEYFFHRVDLRDAEMLRSFGAENDYLNRETGEIKYQVADGSSIDQMLGQWHSEIVGLGEIFEPDKVRTALESMMKYNFKPSMRDVVNPWRVFSLNDEAGTVICAYPDGVKKPSIPVPYCEETMTGFEYQFAGLLAAYGMSDDALCVVRAIRDRYDGKKRNPWNEIECGSNYARSMASFALLTILAGFSFDLPDGHIGFAPRTRAEDGTFRCFWSLGTGYGTFFTDGKEARIDLIEGCLNLSSFGTPLGESIAGVTVDGKEVPFVSDGGRVTFEKTVVKKNIVVKVK